MNLSNHLRSRMGAVWIAPLLLMVSACDDCTEEGGTGYGASIDEPLFNRSETPRDLFLEAQPAISALSEVRLETPDAWDDCPIPFSLTAPDFDLVLQPEPMSSAGLCGDVLDAQFFAQGTLTTGTVLDAPIDVYLTWYFDYDERMELRAHTEQTPPTTAAYDASGCARPQDLWVYASFIWLNGRLTADGLSFSPSGRPPCLLRGGLARERRGPCHAGSSNP
jgi:hypothetical protein